MSAVLKPAPSSAVEAHLEPMTPERLPAVLAVEQSVYSHPWTRGNFTDTLAAGHHALCLLGGDELIGYFVAMRGFEEVHLLNITVAPAHQRQGWALVLLDALVLWSRAQGAQWLWLEVRVSNLRARHVYEQYGFRRVGERKRYYPGVGNEREDAIVMSAAL